MGKFILSLLVIFLGGILVVSILNLSEGSNWINTILAVLSIGAIILLIFKR